MDPKLFRPPMASEPPSGERTLPPPAATPRELAYANLAAKSIEACRQTNIKLDAINARLSLMPKSGETTTGYRWLIRAVVILFVGETALVTFAIRLASQIAKMAK